MITRNPSAGLMAVVIPARDEEELIGRCLQSVIRARNQLSLDRPAVCCRIVVVLDSCHDGTRWVVSATDGVQVVSCHVGRVGEARALGVAHALEDLPDRLLTNCWIANTDADSIVPENWLTCQWQLCEGAVDAMIGTVQPDPADLSADQWQRWTATHQPGRPNGHVHGANLGLGASAYQRAGGFSAVAEHEDNMIIARLKACGGILVASDACQVITSGRRIGRTPGGYAQHLGVSL